VIKRRSRELRALGKRKAAEFRESQVGRVLRVLTLRRDAKDDPSQTPALSENYLSLMIPEDLPHNQWRSVTVQPGRGKTLMAAPIEDFLVPQEE
jgi:tRNA A37 methylthiotransferase MiaB